MGRGTIYYAEPRRFYGAAQDVAKSGSSGRSCDITVQVRSKSAAPIRDAGMRDV